MSEYQGKVRRLQGGDVLEVDSGGEIRLTDVASLLTVGGAVASLLRTHTAVITSAQMLALNATPISILPAPGAGLVNIPIGWLAFLDYNSAAYAGIAEGEDLAFKYTDGSGLQLGSIETTGFLDQTANQLRWAWAYAAASGISSITPVANAAIVAQMLTGEITTGNSPLYIRSHFITVPTTLSV